MGYQNGPATITVTHIGTPVDWIIDYERKMVHVYVGGIHFGAWPNREAAKQALGLVDVPASRKARKSA